jgi:hypothetical protein
MLVRAERVRDEHREIATTLMSQRSPRRLLAIAVVGEFAEVQPRRRCIDGPEWRCRERR